MNIDYYGIFNFGDEEALKSFVLAHRFTHEAESQAIAAQFGGSINTYDVGSLQIIEPWIAMMRGAIQGMPEELGDWLDLHNANHIAMEAFLPASNLGISADLSRTDFSDPEQMQEWLFAHQQMHQYEQQQLGIT